MFWIVFPVVLSGLVVWHTSVPLPKAPWQLPKVLLRKSVLK